MVTLEQVNEAIKHGNFTNDELDSIIMALRYRRAQMTHANKRALSRGSMVRWRSPRDGQTRTGTVTKIAVKYVSVSTPQGVWRVPASMLEMV